MEKKSIVDLLSENRIAADNAPDEESVLNHLPVSIKKRICALKKIQIKEIDLEVEFYQRLRELEEEYSPKYSQIHEERKRVVTGEHEPTEEEADCPLMHGIEQDILEKMYKSSDDEPEGGTKGVPEFWLQVLKGSEQMSQLIEEHDEPVLEHLVDISVDVKKDEFTLMFVFSPNEYFKQTVLKKHYIMQNKPDDSDPFSYEGPIIVQTEGTKIDWKEGRNVTKKVIKKKQKKDGGAARFVTKTVKATSFFNFFDPPTIRINEQADDGEEHDVLHADFDVAELIRDQIVPRAVLYYTGEIGDEDVFDEDYEEGSIEGDAEESDEAAENY